jgi:signal transduction histidine kinase
MATVRDMSYWSELEKEKRISSMKTITFAEAAHEFRNPLNGIIASLDLLEDKYDKQRGFKFYNNARNCSKLLLWLINDILDFA